MAGETIDLSDNYLLLEPDGTSLRLPGGKEFWSQVMSGNATDPGIRQLLGSQQARLLSVLPVGADWAHWEMHPAGDEILLMLAGTATFVLDLPDGLKEVALGAGRLVVIPSGVWHTAKVREPGRLLALTAGSGTQHRPA